jgi:hypothetical protein
MTHFLRRVTALVCIFSMLSGLGTVVRAGEPADDLKQIEYKYYFRGKYAESVSALETFLARVDVKGDVALHANEFLAASHVLAGSPQTGRDLFAKLIATDPSYAGPDAGVFKPEVMDAYTHARADYAARTIKAPPMATSGVPPAETIAPGSGAAPSTTPAIQNVSTPIYKKWWFYAGAAAVIGGVALAAGGGGGDAPASPQGTISVGVNVK